MSLNVGNEYEEVIDSQLYASIPKSVIAAILVSYLQRLGVGFDDVDSAIVEEWVILHGQGIVPQKPPKKFNAMIKNVFE